MYPVCMHTWNIGYGIIFYTLLCDDLIATSYNLIHCLNLQTYICTAAVCIVTYVHVLLIDFVCM